MHVFDCDSHVFEPQDIWDKYLDVDYRVPARSVFWHRTDEGGRVTAVVNGEQAKPMNAGRINRQAIWRPGMTADDIGALDPRRPYPINPGAHDPQARLRDMDSMGIDRALLFPTLFGEYFPVVRNPDVAYALARAYNDWLSDFCKAAPQRLLPVALLPMQEVSFAIEEARRQAGRGCEAVFLRPSFTSDRFLNHPYYDDLWAELDSLGLAAFIHGSTGNTNPEWTSVGSFVERVAANLRIGHNVAEAVAPLMDNALALTAMGFHGHLERYPRLRIAFAHSGASWITLVLEKLETYITLASQIRDLNLEPEEVFFNRPCLLTFDTWETSVPALRDTYENLAAWGSRYPHHDASSPQQAVEMLQRNGAPGDVVAKLMGGNAARFMAGTPAANPERRPI